MEEPQGGGVYNEAFHKCQALLSQAFLRYEPTTSIDSLPSEFVRMVESSESSEDKGNVTYGICMGMMWLANANPTYIDAFLKVYFKAVELSADQRVNSSHTTLAFQILMNMTETGNTGFRTNDWCRVSWIYRPGKDGLVDASIIDFTKEEVDTHLDEVLKVSQQQVREGNDYIVRAGMFARFTILAIETSPAWIGSYGVHDYGIDFQLKGVMTNPQDWASPYLIGALIRLRGYAKTLFKAYSNDEKTKGKMEEWQELLKKWIYDPELNKTNSKLVQHHIIVSGPSRNREN